MEVAKKCCISGYFARDGRMRFYVLSCQCLACNVNGITHSFVVWFCVHRSRSYH